MKAVIRISSRLRQAAPIPRNFLPIPGIEHLGLIYGQRVITDPEDFNKTLSEVRDPRFPSRGTTIEPYMLTAEDEAKLNAVPAKPAAVWTEPGPDAEYKVAVDPSTDPETPETPETPAADDSHITPPDAEPFSLVGNDIFAQGERIASINENGLRMAKGYAERRAEVESWLQSQPTP